MTIQGKLCAVLFLMSVIEKSVHCLSISLPDKNNKYMNSRVEVFKSDLWRNSKSFIESDNFLINTPGCYIPNYIINLKYNTIPRDIPMDNRCGARAVFVETGANNKIYFRIDEKIMRKYTLRTKYRCCYRFAYKSIVEGTSNLNHTDLTFTKCKTFKSGTLVPLEHEIIVVSCTPPKQKKKELYTDAYIKPKRLNISEVYDKTNKAWNVILLGLHSMSRARLFDTMPHTTAYLEKYHWLDFRGFQKVGSSTFPNLVALLTGKNFTTVSANCDSGLYKCAEYFIRNNFMAAGYVTAYGEDYMHLPNTFTKYGGFRIRPTHHYMQTFYSLGEKRAGNIMCLKRQPSATHLLNYIHEFVRVYKHNRFFGMFWINSYSHDTTDDPSILDKELADWFLKLNSTGALKNTFVIFLSDHGTKFGEMKLPIESYYDERLPMLYVSVPNEFKKRHGQKYTNMLVNEYRLITPYDVYVTLGDILKMTNTSFKHSTSEACPRCAGLFKLKSIRWTCADARVSENGCSCRTLVTVDNTATETKHSLQLASEFINNVTESVGTSPCTTCKTLTLQSTLRSHAFKVKDRIYNVVAFEMSNNVRFEATIVYRDNSSRVLYLHTITANNKRGNCVLDQSDRPYCDCERVECEDR